MRVLPSLVCLIFALVIFPALVWAGVTEETFTMPLGQYFVLDQHAGPPVKMRVRNVDVSYIDMDYTDENRRSWSVRPGKHNSVSGREANLTILYRHAATGFEVYYLNTLATPNGQVTIVTRKYR